MEANHGAGRVDLGGLGTSVKLRVEMGFSCPPARVKSGVCFSAWFSGSGERLPCYLFLSPGAVELASCPPEVGSVCILFIYGSLLYSRVSQCIFFPHFSFLPLTALLLEAAKESVCFDNGTFGGGGGK